MLSNIVKKQIKELALKTPNEEICGLLVESGDFILCKNISQNKQNHFELAPIDYLKISKNNKIIGIVHSQKSASPSQLDIINSIGHNLKSYIYSIDKDEFFEVTDAHFKYKQYIGKNFEIGKQDCFSLICSFYKNEYNININNYSRTDNWYKENPNIIKENYAREGFVELKHINELIEGDIIVFSSGHFGIYLDKDLFLHHKRQKLSTIEPLSIEYKSLITNIYRHNLCKFLK